MLHGDGVIGSSLQIRGHTDVGAVDQPDTASREQHDRVNRDYAESRPVVHHVLPPTAILEFFDEGAANILYKIVVPGNEADEFHSKTQGISPGFWSSKLLRLRKDLPTTYSCQDVQQKFLHHVRPYFKDEWLVSQELVELQPCSLISQLNSQLQTMDSTSTGDHLTKSERAIHTRLAKRRGMYLAQDHYGLLVKNMCVPDAFATLIHFKPKWLHQSPTAPTTSVRCRNCAVLASRNHAALRLNASHSAASNFCPLSLVSSSKPAVQCATATILREAGIIAMQDSALTQVDQHMIERVAAWIQDSALLRHLKEKQETLNPDGVLKRESGRGAQQTDGLLTAMTLRDVSCYLIVPQDETAELTCRLGDLDVKSQDKVTRWHEVESELIDGGWYDGREPGMEGVVGGCWLGQ